jgi:hypothetical protein
VYLLLFSSPPVQLVGFMYSLDMSNSRRPPTHQKRSGTPFSGISRTLLADIDKGRITAEQLQNMSMQRQGLAWSSQGHRARTPPSSNMNASTVVEATVGQHHPSPQRRRDVSTPTNVQRTMKDRGECALLTTSPIPNTSQQDSTLALVSFTELCEKAPDGVHPSWITTKLEADHRRQQRTVRETSRKQFVERTKKSLGVEEALEIARVVARQEAIERRSEERNSVGHQVNRFAELELKAHQGLVSKGDRAALLHPELRNDDDVIDGAVERHRARHGADRAFRQLEPQHMMKMASKKILKEEELESFGDELSLLASKSDTARLVGNRNREVRNTLMNQLMSWAQSVLARGDLSDMLEEFIKSAKCTSDGSIRLSDIHAMMRDSGLRLNAAEQDEFNDAVDPRGRGCVVPERLRQVWRSHEAVRRVKAMDPKEAEDMFDSMRLEMPGPITASFLSTWLKRTGSPVDADVCHTIVLRLPRPITKEVIFSDSVFQFLQDIWLDARATEREVLTDAGMMDRARQLETLSAETNDTLEDVERAARLMQQSSSRLVGMHEQLQTTLDATAKLARRVPKTYTKATASNTDVSVTGELVMLWEGFLIQRDLDLLDNDEDEKLTSILAKQNKFKADEIVRLRTVFESVSSKYRHKLALYSQKLEAAEMSSRSLQSQLELSLVGPGGMLDFEQHEGILDAHKREVNDLISQMNIKLATLRGEHQAKARELIHEINLHKNRADEAEQRLLQELENTRQQELRWSAKIDALENDVRGRDDTVNSTAQIISDFEAKYEAQEQRYVAMEAKLQDAHREAERLREQIQIYENETQGIMIPQSEVDRRMDALTAQLTQQIATERASKEQFAKQLQTVTSELQRLEFSSLDKCGTLEQDIQSIRCERDALEKASSDAVGQTIRVLDAVSHVLARERVTISQCTDASATFDAWVQSSQAAVEHMITIVEDVHSELPDAVGSTQDPSVSSMFTMLNECQRRLQQETLRSFAPPSNPVLEHLTAVTSELASTKGALVVADDERRKLAEFSETRDANVIRVLQQVDEFGVELANTIIRDVMLSSTAVSSMCIGSVEPEAYISIEELPTSLGTAVQAVCSSWKRRFGSVLDALGDTIEKRIVQAAQDDEKGHRGKNSAATRNDDAADGVVTDERKSSVTINLVARRSTPGSQDVPPMELLVAAADTTEAVTSQLRSLRQLVAIQERKLLPLILGHSEQSLTCVTREVVARLATQKRAVMSAQSAWRRQMWQYAIRGTLWEMRCRRSDGDASGGSSLWRMRWAVESVSKVTVLLEAIGNLTLTVTSMLSLALESSMDTPRRRSETNQHSPQQRPLSQQPSPIAPHVLGKGPREGETRRQSISSKEQKDHRPSNGGQSSLSTTPRKEVRKESLAVAASTGGSTKGASLKAAATAARTVTSTPHLLGSTNRRASNQVKAPVLATPLTPTTADTGDSPLGLAIAESLAVGHKGGKPAAKPDSEIVDEAVPDALMRDDSGCKCDRELPDNDDDNVSFDDEPFAPDPVDEGTASSPADINGMSVNSSMFPQFEKIRRSSHTATRSEKQQAGLEVVEQTEVDVGSSNLDVTDGMTTRRDEQQDHWDQTLHLHLPDPVPVVSSVARQAPGGDARAPDPQHAAVARSAARHVGCQVDLTVASPATRSAPASSQPTQPRPQSHTRETQTPGLVSGPPLLQRPLAGTPPSECLVDTPTSQAESVAYFPVDPQRRVDSAQRRRMMVPRPQSSDRPRSAIRLDEESAEVLRPPTPKSSAQGGVDPRSAAVAESQQQQLMKHAVQQSDHHTQLTWDELRKKLQTLQSGARGYHEFEFPRVGGQDGGVASLDLDNTLSYLFDNLPAHCRVAVGKYCLLAMFGSIPEDLFVEYVYTHHYLPSRDVFVPPRDDELRRGYWQLRRLGATLMRVRKPTDGDRAAPLKGKLAKQLPPASQGDVAGRVERAFGSTHPVDQDTTQVHRATSAANATRPFSANSFPAAVIILPLEEDPDAAIGPSNETLRCSHLDRKLLVHPGRAVTPSASDKEALFLRGLMCGPGAAVSNEHTYDSVPTTTDEITRDPSPPPMKSRQVEALPTVAVPVQERRISSAPGVAVHVSLPIDRSATANGTLGASDALVAINAVAQQTDDLNVCGEELRAIKRSIRNEEACEAVPATASNSVRGDAAIAVPRPSVVDIPQSKECMMPSRASSGITDGARSLALARATRKLPVLGKRDAASAGAYKTTDASPLVLHACRPASTQATTVMQQRIAEYVSTATQQSIRQGPPMVSQRLAPLPRPSSTLGPHQQLSSHPPITEGSVPSNSIAGSTATCGSMPGVVELPSAPMRRPSV